MRAAFFLKEKMLDRIDTEGTKVPEVSSVKQDICNLLETKKLNKMDMILASDNIHYVNFLVYEK